MGHSTRHTQNGGGDGAAHFPTATGGLARLAYAKLLAAGIPTEPLLIRAGLTKDEIQDSARRIKVRDQIVFLNLAAQRFANSLYEF